MKASKGKANLAQVNDLWFWGFSIQRYEPGSEVRKFEWNDAKYWSIFTAPRDEKSIKKIKALAERTLCEFD